MKKIFFLLSAFFMTSLLQVFAQKESTPYELIENLSYQEEETMDDYMQKRCRLDLYYPLNKSDYTTVVWFHGGGLSAGEKFIPAKLKEQGIAVVAVNYRLHPKVKCPGYIKDAAAAIAWTFKHISEYGGSNEKIVISGHSAGGYLTMITCLDKKWLSSYGIDPDDIAILVPIGGHTITHKIIRKEAGISDKRPIIDEFAPLYHVRSDSPPLFLITGDRELEIYGRYEENAYMYRMMKINGHKDIHLFELDGFNHNTMSRPGLDLLLRFIKERIK
jgi:acetyl esterase/lipase